MILTHYTLGKNWLEFFFLFLRFFFFISWRLITLQYCSGFVIHWHESAMNLHVFPIPLPPPTSLSTRSLWVFPVHKARALVSCIQPELVICFTLVSMLFSSWNFLCFLNFVNSPDLFQFLCLSLQLHLSMFH